MPWRSIPLLISKHTTQNMASCDPLIGIHDRFDQQSKSLELSEIKIFHSLIKATIDPVAITFLVDREVLIQRLTLDAIDESIIIQELSGFQLQAHAFKPLKA